MGVADGDRVCVMVPVALTVGDRVGRFATGDSVLLLVSVELYV